MAPRACGESAKGGLRSEPRLSLGAAPGEGKGVHMGLCVCAHAYVLCVSVRVSCVVCVICASVHDVYTVCVHMCVLYECYAHRQVCM